MRIAVILAGGGGRRMGGADKGALMLGRARMIDRVAARLKPQVDRILISGTHDYGTGLAVIADLEDGPLGPAAGLWAALQWIEKNAPDVTGFLTAPVDGPFAPDNLFERLSIEETSAVAETAEGAHPTFAWWTVKDLQHALVKAPKGEGLSLKALANGIGARRVMFDDADAFLNINTPEELERAEALLRA